MAVIREILTRWTTINGSGKVTVMYFESAIDVADQRDHLNNFWQTIKPTLDNSASYVIDTDGRELEDSTGGLTGSWSDVVPYGGAGGGGGEPVADATQGLIRWKCADIINGRFLQGRTFIPGCASSAEVAGNVLPATRAVWQGAANSLISAGSGLVIWHRPGGTGPGSHDAVSTARVWSEFAVLRRRRG